MNDKFQRLRREVLATFGIAEETPEFADLPVIKKDLLDAEARDDWQVRLYHLWERLKHFRPSDLDERETGDRDRLASHVQHNLGLLHGTANGDGSG